MVSRWSAQIEIDKICDHYEDDWRSGRSKALDFYLDEIEPQARKRLFQELVLVDRELRSSNAEAPTWDEYRTDFPTFANEVEELRFKWELSSSGRGSVQEFDAISPLRVARFQLEELIGRGAGGVVWKAWDPRLTRYVAIKLPHATRVWEEVELTRLFREARAVAKLNHSQIVPIYEVDQFENRPYIVSKLIIGQDLRSLLASSTIAPQQAAKLCCDAAQALHHAHLQGVIHRDIKPSNILVDTQGAPYITDFGLAEDTDQDAASTIRGVIIGTPAYMSPEQASAGAVAVDPRTDVYSLGVVLYEMLTRQRPFSNQPYSLVSDYPRPDPPLPRSINRSVPRDLESICLKAIETEPAARYRTAAEFAEDLQRFLAGEPVQARGYSRIARAWKRLKRHPARITIGCLLVLTATAASAAGFFAQQNDELRGLQMVAITSDPPEATLAVVPLDEVTYEPNRDPTTHIHGSTPFEEELPPGDYLIVAALPDGRFHEVYRHVPKDATALPAGYRHLWWGLRKDGSVELEPIVIPPLETTERMAPIVNGLDRFWMDCHEYTVGEYQSYVGHTPIDTTWQPVADDYAVTVNFHDAMVLAERLGKRLPSIREYEIAVAKCDPSKTPPARAPLQSALTLFDDVTRTSPPISGLRSNVAEWTITRPSRAPRVDSEEAALIPGLALFQIIQPGNLGLNSQGEQRPGGGSVISIRPQYEFSPDLGFRCVRSAAPRFIVKQ